MTARFLLELACEAAELRYPSNSVAGRVALVKSKETNARLFCLHKGLATEG